MALEKDSGAGFGFGSPNFDPWSVLRPVGIATAGGMLYGLGKSALNDLNTAGERMTKFATQQFEKLQQTSPAVAETLAKAGQAVKDEVPTILDFYRDSLIPAMNQYSTSAVQAAEQQASAVNAFNERMMERQMEYNAAEAQKSRDWQEYMSNTAYQRAMADAKAAGLNPILLYNSLNPSTGSASQASASAASGVQANIASAKNADKMDSEDMKMYLLLPLVSSAVRIVEKLIK